jgi:hypothetical protein
MDNLNRTESVAAELGLRSFRCPSCNIGGLGIALHRVGDGFARSHVCPTCLGGGRIWRDTTAGGFLTWEQVLKLAAPPIGLTDTAGAPVGAPQRQS